MNYLSRRFRNPQRHLHCKLCGGKDTNRISRYPFREKVVQVKARLSALQWGKDKRRKDCLQFRREKDKIR